MATIRKATEKDLPRIIELYEELTEEKLDISPELQKQVFNEILSMPRHALVVAEENGMVLGTLVLQIVPNLSHHARPWSQVENVVVDKRYRRKGIGRLLMDYAVNRSREAGCYKVQLASSKKRLEAHEFYRSIGFQDSSIGFRYYLK
jgi:ribosomal protein S18 acetylase RimI-like enzyme